MKFIGKALCLVAVSLAAPALFAADLAGYWKNDEQPAWIEIRFEDGRGTGTVARNDEHPDRVGRVLLKDVRADEEESGSWKGQVYAERLEEYKDAGITLTDPDHMQIKVKVGFMSRTVTWTRAAGLPLE